MKARFLYVSAAFIVLAAFIWLRDQQWRDDIEDTVPCLLAFPLAYWLGKPWALRDDPLPISLAPGIVCAGFFLGGIAFSSTMLLALAWSLGAAAWLKSNLEGECWTRIKPLALIAILGFPWIYLDAQPLSWWFRISGASAVGAVFHLVGFVVQQQGTSLLVQGMPMEVEPACGGLNALQSMLLGGVSLAYVYFGPTRRFWINVPFILPAAWIANTVRLIVICASGLTYGVPFAMGLFHKTGGFVVVAAVFTVLAFIFNRQTHDREASEQ
jgi:exosortase/archaeosortase family protein